MNIKASAEDAGWTIREAAWELEERLLWRGSDAASRVLGAREEATDRALDLAEEAAFRASRAVAPLQRLIQTKVTWPLSDALRERGTAARAGIATAAAATAIAAGVAGATVGAPGASPVPPPDTSAATNAAAPLVQTASAPTVLQGPAPAIELGDATVKPPPPAPAAAPTTAEPPARVAWRFAQAFVLYEVGKSDAKIAATFAETAQPALANSLAVSPPRLPDGTKVPEARVLNVVLADRTKKQVIASVSLARLRAVSEVRMTLAQSDKGVWRVAQVLG
jgi:hypothetical protein